MTVKIKVSYEHDHERDQILRALQPVLNKAKVRHQADKYPYKRVYIEIRAPVGESPKNIVVGPGI